MSYTAEQYLEKAATCYRAAGHNPDACRCLEHLQRFGEAGHLHRQEGRWLEAAHAFEQGDAWEMAAVCYREADELEDAVRCFEAGGQRLEACWLLVHVMDRPERALAMLVSIQTNSLAEQLVLELLVGRCQGNRRNTIGAAVVIKRMANTFSQLEANTWRERCLEWGLDTAESMRRLDLAAELLAAATEANMTGAREKWEKWALHHFKTAEGIPVADADQPKMI